VNSRKMATLALLSFLAFELLTGALDAVKMSTIPWASFEVLLMLRYVGVCPILLLVGLFSLTRKFQNCITHSSPLPIHTYTHTRIHTYTKDAKTLHVPQGLTTPSFIDVTLYMQQSLFLASFVAGCMFVAQLALSLTVGHTLGIYGSFFLTHMATLLVYMFSLSKLHFPYAVMSAGGFIVPYILLHAKSII